MFYSQEQGKVPELFILLLYPLFTCVLQFLLGMHHVCQAFRSFRALYVTFESARTGRQIIQICSVLIAPNELDRSAGLAAS